jgi:WD40 repeat protein
MQLHWVSLSPDEHLAVTGTFGNLVQVWDLENGAELSNFIFTTSERKPRVMVHLPPFSPPSSFFFWFDAQVLYSFCLFSTFLVIGFFFFWQLTECRLTCAYFRQTES